MIILQGLIFFVELKAHGQEMRKLQTWRRMQLEREGFKVILIDSIEKVDELIDKIVGGKHEQLHNYIQFSKF